MARLNEPRVHADVTNLCTSMNYYETEQDAKATPTEHQIGGGVDVFYGGRHALKTYVCVRKSSSNAMGRLVRAENII